jgi:hypothetical protein
MLARGPRGRLTLQQLDDEAFVENLKLRHVANNFEILPEVVRTEKQQHQQEHPPHYRNKVIVC